jgi:hypothetical protein
MSSRRTCKVFGTEWEREAKGGERRRRGDMSSDERNNDRRLKNDVTVDTIYRSRDFI